MLNCLCGVLHSGGDTVIGDGEDVEVESVLCGACWHANLKPESVHIESREITLVQTRRQT